MQLKSFIILTISPKPKAAAANFLRVCKVVTAPLCALVVHKKAAEQTFSVPNADAKVWELSERERQIIAELNHKDNESPCAAP